MPTVRDDIEPVAVFPAPKGKTRCKRLSVFPAQHWERWGGKAGEYRLMLGEQWVTRTGERVSFYTDAAYKEFLGRWGLSAIGLDQVDAPSPKLAKGQYVRWEQKRWNPLSSFSAPFIKSKAASDPVHCFDGVWRIMVCGQFVPCSEVVGLDIYGRVVE